MNPLPDPALILLVGAAGSGKTTWARERYREQEIVSSDELRARVGSGPADMDASADAFSILQLIADRRVSRGLTTVVDTLGLDEALRRRLLEAASARAIPAIAVVMRTSPERCKQRNRGRPRPVPTRVLDGQLRRMKNIAPELEAEGWTVLEVADGEQTEQPAPRDLAERTRDEAAGPLRFHLHLGRLPGDSLAETLTDVAVAAEQAGFTGLSVMDHFIQIPQVGREWEPMPESLALLGHLGSVTERARLMVLVSGVTHRHPAVLGRQLATLDVLTGGRVTCGLGAGWYRQEHDAYGIPFPPDRDRLDLLEDTVRFLPLLWGPGSPGFEGKILRVDKAIGYPRPPQGRIPILVGGGGERRTLRIAAHHADAWNVRGDIEVFRRKMAVVEAHCRDVGRDPDELSATLLDVTIVGADRTEVADLVERHRGRSDAADYARRDSAGTVASHVARYRLLRQAGVDEVYVAPVDSDLRRAVERFAPVIAASI